MRKWEKVQDLFADDAVVVNEKQGHFVLAGLGVANVELDGGGGVCELGLEHFIKRRIARD